ncbi:hypothetical protein ATE68_22025 [Sphingopyxis sp. H038]|uniref:DUF1173 domain-containing protein n=1 Tax=unclassified Sphingopyxis TaxID=2614943 RepID=UPI0007300F10|nr:MULTISPECIES: DUF1173 domain-containing protein [unclassified Sphingopyxis]KTE02886.1 hypothetical protein ATE78_06050 [Sphingopyxis sp. H012]KTE04928.1 hypothetical protein ATE76_22755 [Sphingopyxis sp. H093]KTE10268.1 hypothetical protein ATE70_10300 [Sphingopyxis sp. H053]KTE23230.1 hypothetical protein ATE75_19765 [Sphingopyxis sp. H080]KTE31344.1 hypothetical protein ATE68_22025 [Sphingopyxis sp. H038]
MQRYYVLDREIAAGEDGFEAMVARAYTLKQAVRCLCRRDIALDLYISHRHGGHVLSRWPGTGPRHAPHCDHYEAPDHLTGLGQVLGSAIVDDIDNGVTTLKFGFPLSKGPARAAPASFTNDKPDVKATGQRLTMRGMLHFLWDRAQLTHWHPRMAGKRNWYIVRRQLLNAALGCKVRGDALAQRLFIPEPFRLDDQNAIEGRRAAELSVARSAPDRIMLLIGEVRSIEGARYGEKILVRHLPDWPFLMDADMARRFHKRFAAEEELWRSDDRDGHLIIAASFSIGTSGLAQIYEMSVMPVTREWMPYEGLEERSLVTQAVDQRRHFVKGMRVNLGLEAPIASLTLTDTGAEATAVYLAHNLPEPRYDEALQQLMRTRGVEHMTWRPGSGLQPARARSTAIIAPGSATAQ